MTRALTLAIVLVLASGMPARAATVIHADAFDAGVPGVAAGSGTFPGGSANVTFRAVGTAVPASLPAYPAVSASLPGIGNRAVLDFDTSVSGGDAYGVITLGSTCVGGSNAGNGCLVSSECPSGSCVAVTSNDLTGEAYVAPILGPIPKCVGGTRAGSPCELGSTLPGNSCNTGVCVEQRVPFLSVASASARGCTIWLQQSCQEVDKLTNVCTGVTEKLVGIYGGAYLTGGRCGSSKTMNDTPCGGACTTAADCLQGRPDYATTGSAPVACVNDADETVSCNTAACHCINECDEERPQEATCAPKYFGNVARTQGQPYALGVRQTNDLGSPGIVSCAFLGGPFVSLCVGGTNAGATCVASSECTGGGACVSNQPQVFQRGPSDPTKVGVCTGSSLASGGRAGTACGADSQCGCGCYGGTNAGGPCTADSQCPGGGTCPGSCTPGTCTTTARITPDRLVAGWNDGTSPKARALVDTAMIQSGSNPATAWRAETTIASAGGTLTQQWTSSGNSCSNDGCLTYSDGAGSLEPDDPGTVATVTRLQHTTSSNFTHEWLLGDVATTSDTVLAASFNVAAQDTEGASNDAASIRLGLRRATGGTLTAADFDLAAFEPDDGASARYYPLRPLTITTDPAGGTFDRTAVNALIGQIIKGNPHAHASAEPRVTFSVLSTFLGTVAPLKTNVLPGSKRVSVCCDSTSNFAVYYQTLAGLNPEIVTLYDQASGGVAMGDVLLAAPTLFAGGSTARMPTTAIIGTTGQAVDVMIIDGGASNTFRLALTAAPEAPTAYSGLGQSGYCEDWNASTGYGSMQGKACHCDENSDWVTGDFYSQLCLMKNGLFGLPSIFTTCACTTNADCELGGTAPPGTKTTTTCSGGKCVSSYSAVGITASASTRAMTAPGCVTATCPACVSGNSIARMLAAKRSLEAMAAATGTRLVWKTAPPGNGIVGDGKRTGWYESRPFFDAWRATLLAEQRAIGGNWIDLYQYFIDLCAPNILLPGVVNACLKDNIHSGDFGNAERAKLDNAALSNTTLDGITNKKTDGVCTVAETTTCVSGRCNAGLRRGMACGADADCNWCSGGAAGKLGQRCNPSWDPAAPGSECGYYRAVF